MNELISYCIEEKERIKLEITESAQLASTYKDMGIDDVMKLG